jgi:hypothetical protein
MSTIRSRLPRFTKSRPRVNPEGTVSSSRVIPENPVSSSRVIPENPVSSSRVIPEGTISSSRVIPENPVSQKSINVENELLKHLKFKTLIYISSKFNYNDEHNTALMNSVLFNQGHKFHPQFMKLIIKINDDIQDLQGHANTELLKRFFIKRTVSDKEEMIENLILTYTEEYIEKETERLLIEHLRQTLKQRENANKVYYEERQKKMANRIRQKLNEETNAMSRENKHKNR